MKIGITPLKRILAILLVLAMMCSVFVSCASGEGNESDSNNDESYASSDLNGDGEINFLLVDCTSSKGISDHQTYVSKQQKLQTLLMSDTEVMLFVTDAERFEWIDNLGNGNFIENTGLPHNGGKSYNLSDTGILQTAKEKIDPNEQLIWPKELYISRRTVKGTLFEGRDGVEENLKNADELVRNLIGKNTK